MVCGKSSYTDESLTWITITWEREKVMSGNHNFLFVFQWDSMGSKWFSSSFLPLSPNLSFLCFHIFPSSSLKRGRQTLEGIKFLFLCFIISQVHSSGHPSRCQGCIWIMMKQRAKFDQCEAKMIPRTFSSSIIKRKTHKSLGTQVCCQNRRQTLNVVQKVKLIPFLPPTCVLYKNTYDSIKYLWHRDPRESQRMILV